jgi:hypothetical protein
MRNKREKLKAEIANLVRTVTEGRRSGALLAMSNAGGSLQICDGSRTMAGCFWVTQVLG